MNAIPRFNEEITGPGIRSLPPADQASILAAHPATVSAAEWASLVSFESGDAASVAASARAAAEVTHSFEMDDIHHHDGEGEADAKKEKEASEAPFTSLERLFGENQTNESPHSWSPRGLLKAIVTTAVELYNNPGDTLLSGARWILKTGEELWESTQKFIQDTISRAENTLSDVKSDLSNTVTEIGGWISEKAGKAYNSLSHYFNFGSSLDQPTPSAGPTPTTADTPAELQNLKLRHEQISQTADPSLPVIATGVPTAAITGGYVGHQPHRIALFSERGLETETAKPAQINATIRPNFAAIVKATSAEPTNAQPMPV